MNLVKKSGLVLILAIFMITGAVSCSTTNTVEKTVYPADYDSIKADLATANTQIASLQTQADTLQNQLNALEKQVSDKSAEADNLSQQYAVLNSQYQVLSTQDASNLATIADLQAKYQELKTEHDLAIQQAAEVTAANIETALLAAINKDRTDNGLSVLLKGTNIITMAQNNSRAMAQAKGYLSVINPYQEESIVTGYNSVDSLVSAVMTIWKSDTHWYETNVLAANAIYGTVAVYLSGGIYYITFIASNFP
jgi:septal ring factor EnvC (AmiA/AmiB activator)